MNWSRKRTLSGCNNYGNVAVSTGTSTQPSKKKRKPYKRGTFVPPTKFLLGGNIRDPLNLNGLREEDESKVEEEHKNDVDLPELAEFLLGGNVNDPLNLKGIAEEKVEKDDDVQSIASCDEKEKSEIEDNIKSVKQDVLVDDDDERSEVDNICTVTEIKAVSLNLSLQHDLKNRKFDRKDKIVSPVIPQPYRPLKTVPFRQIITPDLRSKIQKTPKFKEKNTRFQYGNYRRYYGYRNFNGIDLRLEIFEKNREFFENKDVLDIGCNVGHVSFIIARSFNAKTVTGIDIDRHLIEEAKKNVQYYVTCPSPYSVESPSTAAIDSSNRRVNLKYKCYPVSMPILYGPIYDNDFRSETRGIFPKNVKFVHGNYVLESESLLQIEQPQFDTILCLSVSKWIHLNWGDEGLKMAFKRMYAQLRPGGILILEPQSWDSYKRRKNLTETIWRNFQSIQLFPHHFDRYLLSSEVGFSQCQTLSVVSHPHKGFRRAIKVFKKSATSIRSNVSSNDDVSPNDNVCPNDEISPSDKEELTDLSHK